MVNMSQDYFNAATNSLLQSVADMASKVANLAGQLAEAHALIERQRAKIAELESPLKEQLKVVT